MTRVRGLASWSSEPESEERQDLDVRRKVLDREEREGRELVARVEEGRRDALELVRDEVQGEDDGE